MAEFGSNSKQIIETTTTIVEYVNNIIYLRMKDGAEVNLENTIEQFKAQAELTKNDYYGVLVDGRNYVIMDKESRKYMATHMAPKRVATALLTQHNIAMRLLANIYMKIDKPTVETRLFGEEAEAVKWLNARLQHKRNLLKRELHTNNYNK